MISLATRYLGIDLAHPIVPGASPLADDLDAVLRLEDAGACAIVMRSIFEEQITLEQMAGHHHLRADLGAEAASVLPDTYAFSLGVETYLDQIRRIRERTKLAVIGSLNGTTPGGWLEYAQSIAQAGAAAIELNVYVVPGDATRTAEQVEREQVATVRDIVRSVDVPIAVKLSPYYTSLPAFALALGQAGARGIVVFNRFYQADIDPERLETVRALRLSSPEELLLRIRWMAILSAQPRLGLEIAASGGVHGPIDAIKAIMAGATTVQLVSALLLHGPARLREIIDGVGRFLEEHEYESIDVMRGSMNRARTANPAAYERADYIHLLQSWHGTN